MGGPLAGITVVALEQAVSAPMCTRTLGDFGARVIKVENPRGGDFARHYDDVVGGLAAHFVWVNRGKESVALDLKSAAGLAALHRLLERADVLVSNLAPGATAKLGLSPPTWKRATPISSRWRSTGTAPAARCPTSVPTTSSSRPSRGRAR